MDNERKIVDLKQTPSPWQALSSSLFCPDPDRTGCTFVPEIFERVSESLYKDQAPLYDQPMVLE
jgi:hypothetical protein